jgi:ribosomal protein S18 acetylase RimI-like enzyme
LSELQKDYEVVKLVVTDGNIPAQHLYQKLGFVSDNI